MSTNRAVLVGFILFFSTLSLNAQERLFLLNPDTASAFFQANRGVIGLHGNVYQQSDGVTNSFVNKFLNSGFIDEALKDGQRVSGSENLFGAGFQFGISALIAPDSLFGSDRFGLRVGLSHHDDLSLRFDEDVFNAVFYGNKQFAGQSVSLSNSGFRYQRFQQLQIGFFEKSTMSYVSVGLISGNQFIDLGFDEASLYTSPSGSFVELAADGRFFLSDTAKTAGLAMNGIGAALSFEVNIPFRFNRRPNRPSYLRIGGQNVGFTRWSDQTVQYEIDSTYNYQGFLVDDLAAFGDLNNELDNVVDSLLPSSTVDAHYMTTPGWLYLSWLSPLSDEFYYELEVRAKIYAYHLPVFAGSLLYQPNKKWLVGFRATYGGYGGYDGIGAFRAGLFASAFVGRRFMFNVSSDNLTGWVVGQSTGRHAQFSFNYLF